MWSQADKSVSIYISSITELSSTHAQGTSRSEMGVVPVIVGDRSNIGLDMVLNHLQECEGECPLTAKASRKQNQDLYHTL